MVYVVPSSKARWRSRDDLEPHRCNVCKFSAMFNGHVVSSPVPGSDVSQHRPFELPRWPFAGVDVVGCVPFSSQDVLFRDLGGQDPFECVACAFFFTQARVQGCDAGKQAASEAHSLLASLLSLDYAWIRIVPTPCSKIRTQNRDLSRPTHAASIFRSKPWRAKEQQRVECNRSGPTLADLRAPVSIPSASSFPRTGFFRTFQLVSLLILDPDPSFAPRTRPRLFRFRMRRPSAMLPFRHVLDRLTRRLTFGEGVQEGTRGRSWDEGGARTEGIFGKDSRTFDGPSTPLPGASRASNAWICAGLRSHVRDEGPCEASIGRGGVQETREGQVRADARPQEHERGTKGARRVLTRTAGCTERRLLEAWESF